MSDNNVLLRVDNLVKHFPIMRGVFQKQVGAVRAVDGISFEVKRGEIVGLVSIGDLVKAIISEWGKGQG